jgi:hypothetical protein
MLRQRHPTPHPREQTAEPARCRDRIV